MGKKWGGVGGENTEEKDEQERTETLLTASKGLHY